MSENIDRTDRIKFNNMGLARKFTVKISEWLRGETNKRSALLREKDGKKCCLGFCALSSGYTRKDISEIGSLSTAGVVQDFQDKSGTVLFDLMMANDNPKTTDSQKQKTLTRLFKKIGVNVKFVK